MLALAKAGRNDVFCDLGCGWAQNLIIALTEFHVKRAIGFERSKDRYEIALKRLRRRNEISKERYQVFNRKFEDLLNDKLPDVKLADITIIFYGLSTNREVLEKIAMKVRPRTRLLYYFNCLFPEILPNDSDFPFFVSVARFKKPRSEYAWLSAILRKDKSSLRPEKKPSVAELWDEFKHDYDVDGNSGYVKGYQKRLAAVLREKKRS